MPASCLTRHQRKVAGYTLIELLVVFAVLALLASMAMPMAEMTVRRQREIELKRALWEIRDAIDAYKRSADAGEIPSVLNSTGYPPTLNALTTGVREQRESGRLRYFLRRIPKDPFSNSSIAAENSWQLRSYRGATSGGQPGEDVYDVSSMSDATGLNGIPLKQW